MQQTHTGLASFSGNIVKKKGEKWVKDNQISDWYCVVSSPEKPGCMPAMWCIHRARKREDNQYLWILARPSTPYGNHRVY